MRLFASLVLCLLGGLGGCESVPKSTARAIVTFNGPGNFTDFKSASNDSSGEKELERELSDYVQLLASRYLNNDEILSLTFNDIDLAGEIEPSSHSASSNVRSFGEGHPPRLIFTFTIMGNRGAVIKRGSENLTDMSYLTHMPPKAYGALKFEKAMLEDWARSKLQHEVKSQYKSPFT